MKEREREENHVSGRTKKEKGIFVRREKERENTWNELVVLRNRRGEEMCDSVRGRGGKKRSYLAE